MQRITKSSCRSGNRVFTAERVYQRKLSYVAGKWFRSVNLVFIGEKFFPRNLSYIVGKQFVVEILRFNSEEGFISGKCLYWKYGWPLCATVVLETKTE